MRLRSLQRSRCRNSTKLLAISFFIVSLIIYCYLFFSGGSSFQSRQAQSLYHKVRLFDGAPEDRAKFMAMLLAAQDEVGSTCSALETRPTDIDTVKTYPTFDFTPSWLRSREFWDRNFEDRFTHINSMPKRRPLKVIIVPHSHNDPGWLQTFETYFALKTKNIINNIVQKLKQYPNMTFIWTEMSFLHKWWESAHPTKQKILKELIEEGRLEITTGGWVMPDEANTHIYALIDQLIEGHLWLNITFGVTPTTGWSIDPFGHGPTVPYLLAKSGIKGTIIQRIHYAWKQYLAYNQVEDFYWMPGWQSMNRPTMITHNQPFDIYSIKSSCGPHPSVCLSFDFKRIPGEYTEYSVKHDPITAENVHTKSKILMEEYDRIGSLTKHNVVLVPLGDDFRYEHDIEFDEQYENYNRLITYINSHKKIFNAELSFGTPKDYFDALSKRQTEFPSLKGDFFVYADIYSEGKPAYWSGYYTTRPYIKILARQLEHNLRNSEILFTLVSNLLKKSDSANNMFASKRLDKHYEELITARRNLGLFQHHDAITGTSKAAVMLDYGTKLFTSLYHCSRIQEMALSTVLLPDLSTHAQALQTESEWETYGKQPHKMKVHIKDLRDIVLFNTLGQNRTDVITILSNTSTVSVYNHFTKEYVDVQTNPVVEKLHDGQYRVSNKDFEIVFIAELPGLTAVTFTLRNTPSEPQVKSSLFCNVCSKEILKRVKKFNIERMLPGDILLENERIKILIDRNTGFLKRIHRKSVQRKYICEVQFGAYRSAQRHSGAYLFMTDFENPERDVLNSYVSQLHGTDAQLIIVTGPIVTEIKTLFGPFLTHKIRIHHSDHAILAESIYMENIVDFDAPPKNRDTELFIRLQTNIQNGDVPEFYTDQNGFQFQKRVKVTKLNIEANYYPITTMAFLQDEQTRMTFVTDHAQGASAFEPGRLEIMLDRRTLYDDYRGMGEGVVDNKPTVFKNWILLEALSQEKEETRFKRDTVTPVSFRGRKTKTVQHNDESHVRENLDTTSYQLPSSTANQLSRQLNYPVNTFIVDPKYSVVNDSLIAAFEFFKNFPTDLHLINLRTISDNIYDIPGRSSLMIVQRQANSCLAAPMLSTDDNKGYGKFHKDSAFNNLTIDQLSAVSLTGLYTEEVLDTLSDIQVNPMEIQCYKLTFQ